MKSLITATLAGAFALATAHAAKVTPHMMVIANAKNEPYGCGVKY